MAKNGGKNGKDSEGQYVPLPYALLKSQAWRSLSGAAVKVFFELHTRFNGGNNGQVRLSLNEAVAALGIGKATAKRAFDELEAKGFIELVTPGAWYHRRAHEWRLTHKPMQTFKGKQVATNDWRKWHPKTKRGSQAEPSANVTGPKQNPKAACRSATEPVTAKAGTGLGAEMEH